MDRMAVNAAIETLIKGSDALWVPAARLVIQFGTQIPSSGDLVRSFSTQETEQVAGYSPGMGNVGLGEHRPEVTEWSSASTERVGYYRIGHHEQTRELDIQHYLASGSFVPAPEDGAHFGYLLTYDARKEPTLFCEVILRQYDPDPLSWLQQEMNSSFMGTKMLLRAAWSRLQGNPTSLKSGHFKETHRVLHSAVEGIVPGQILAHQEYRKHTGA